MSPLTAYRIDIQQGNAITQEMVAKLKPGMTRAQVRFALGTPLIASDRAALPEVVGDAGLVLPLDVDAWAGALDAVRANRATYVALGGTRATRYLAADSARDLVTAYRMALS